MAPDRRITPLLQVSVSRCTIRAVIRCAGEIDLSNVHHLEAYLDECLESGIAEVQVDLRAVTFLDSCTLNALARTDHQLRTLGRVLTVRTRRRRTRLFVLAGLAHLLDTSATGGTTASTEQQAAD